MNNASLELGGTNWAEKDASLLGYTVSDDSGRFFPQEFTFSRGSNLAATRIGKTGLIEKGRENLLVQSNQFDTTWTVAGSTITDGQSGYDGSNNAWLLSKSSASGNLGQNTTSNGVTTFSVYAKANASPYLRLIIFDGTFAANGAAYFDLQNGALGTTNAIDSNIESVGNGWYRCSVSFNTSNQRVYIYPAEANSTTGTTGSIYIQDAQLEQGLAASPYIPTTTTTAQAGVLENTPRLNYTTGVADPYLLLEPSRTNVIDYSEYLNAHSVALGANGGTMTITDNHTTSPEGLQNAGRIQASIVDTNDTSEFALFKANGVVLLTGDNVVSFYAKSMTGVDQDVLVYWNYSQEIITITNDWQRFEINANATSSSSLLIGCRGGTGNYYSGGDANLDFALWGLQVEQSTTYPTSYIPTYSVSATRAADSCSKTDASGEIGQTEGTIFVDVDFEILSGINMFVSIRPDLSNKIEVYRSDANIYGEFSSSSPFNFSKQNIDVGRYKIALAYSSGSSAMYINGVLVGSNTTPFAFTSTLDDIYINSRGSQFLEQSKYKQVQLYKTRLTNAELATLTTI